jgi:hypothetical protein
MNTNTLTPELLNNRSPQLEPLSRKKRNARLDEIKLACQQYISVQLRETLGELQLVPSEIEQRESVAPVAGGGSGASEPVSRLVIVRLAEVMTPPLG